MTRPVNNPRKRAGKSDAMIRREKLQQIDDTGSTDGINARSLARFWQKGYLEQNGAYVRLTRMGRAVAKGRIGAAGRGAVDMSQANREAGKVGGMNSTRGHAARAAAMRGSSTPKETAAEKRERQAQEAAQAAAWQQEQTREKKSIGKILPAYALKISLSNGGPITREHLNDLTGEGWQVLPSATAPGKVGRTLPGSVIDSPEDSPIFFNGDPLGPAGMARAVIVWTGHKLDKATVEGFRAAGWDVSAAPKRYRLEPAPVKNPHGNAKATTGKILNSTWEITGTKASGYYLWIDGTLITQPGGTRPRKFKTIRTARQAIAAFLERFPVKNPTKNPSPGERKHGPHASADERIAAAAALKKARAFFGNDDLVTEPQALRSYRAPEAFVDIGDFVAIEYDSPKFDGTDRIYRHEGTRKRRCLLSIDGTTMVFDPPFKLTKRGIEG